jgi:hypothetical protein
VHFQPVDIDDAALAAHGTKAVAAPLNYVASINESWGVGEFFAADITGSGARRADGGTMAASVWTGEGPIFSSDSHTA